VTTQRVFISYRRQGDVGNAGHLARILEDILGPKSVFLDTRSISPGATFPEALMGAIEDACVVLVLIGPNWLSVTDDSHRRRIDHQQDWVRQEILTALRMNKLTIPVTINTELPKTSDLDQDLAPLLEREGFRLDSDSWERDASALAYSLLGFLEQAEAPSVAEAPADSVQLALLKAIVENNIDASVGLKYIPSLYVDRGTARSVLEEHSAGIAASSHRKSIEHSLNTLGTEIDQLGSATEVNADSLAPVLSALSVTHSYIETLDCKSLSRADHVQWKTRLLAELSGHARKSFGGYQAASCMAG
jgi:hypothetical protein